MILREAFGMLILLPWIFGVGGSIGWIAGGIIGGLVGEYSHAITVICVAAGALGLGLPVALPLLRDPPCGKDEGQ